MKTIPEIVKEHVLKHQGRMPQTDKEIDEYLDLINHAKEYAEAAHIESLVGKNMMRKLGFKTKDQVKASASKQFQVSHL